MDAPVRGAASRAAIILTGGSARRLGGVSKPLLTVGGRTLWEHALAACEGFSPVVGVGPVLPTSREDVAFVREDPPGSGPVAALAAGLAAMEPERPSLVAVLAVDVPGVGEVLPAVATAASASGGAGAWAVDPDHRPQPLLAVYRREAILGALAELDTVENASMRDLTAPLAMTAVPGGAATRDADTWDDVTALRREER